MATANVQSPVPRVKPLLTRLQRKGLRLAALSGDDPFRDAFEDDPLAVENAASQEAQAYFRDQQNHLRWGA